MSLNIKAWTVWSIAALFVLYQFLLQTSTSVMVPHLMRDFSINAVYVGLLSSSFFYTYILLQIPSGLLVDRIGAKLVLSLSLAICGIASFLFAFSHSFAMAECSRLIMGLATAPAVVCTLYLASNWFPARFFALLAGLTEMLGMLGGAIGEQLLARSVQHIGWRSTLIACGFIGVSLALVTWLIVRDRPVNAPKPYISLKQSNTSLWSQSLQIVGLPQAWLNGLFAGLVFVLIQAFASLWAVPYFMQRFSIGLNTAAGLSAMVFFGTALGAPLAGWYSERVRQRRNVMLCGASGALFAIMLILYGPLTSIASMFVWLFILGFFCGSYVIPFAVVRDITPAPIRGTAMGYVNMMCIALGAPLVQPLIGWVLHRSDHSNDITNTIFSISSYQTAFITLPICLTLALLITFFIREPNR
ncbi:MFS transporter [soil metagenome]